jgi:hypothetical protein
MAMFVASPAQAASLSITASSSVVLGDDFSMTVSGSPDGPSAAYLTILAAYSGSSCPTSWNYGDGLADAYQGTSPSSDNGITWPLEVSAYQAAAPFSMTIGANSQALGAAGTWTLCAEMDGTGDGTDGATQATANIVVKAPRPSPTEVYRNCSAHVSRMSHLEATRAMTCGHAVRDLKTFATSSCATRDGILLKTLDGSGYAYCDPRQRLECVAASNPRRGSIRVACGEIGALGFLDGHSIEFAYRLRKLI